ncbi:MAG: ABC transporter substrate-binding protein [Nitrososphaera sp.]|nr:ABC transporter substrate-binding protein [Nitrososphaera sp.]
MESSSNRVSQILHSDGVSGQYTTPDKYKDHLLEQYKLYLQSAETNSERRHTANSFFLTLNTALIAFVSYISLGSSANTTPKHDWLVALGLVALAGIALSYMWYRLIRSYRDLNSAKFAVIHEIEKTLPLSPFDAEWEAVGRGKDPKRYLPFTHVEIRIPFVFLTLHLLVFLLAASTAFGFRTDDRPSYRIGLGPWIGFGPLYLAKEKGYFDEAGLNVDLIVLTGLAERNSALKSENVDALAAPVDYFVLSAGNKLETTIVMAIDESVGGDGIVARKDIQKIEDLRGKKVAFQRGLPSEFFIRALLRDHGVSLDEIQSLDMETAQAGAAFLADKVDAAAVWEPWLTKAKEGGNGHILASTREYRDLIVDVLAFNKSVVAKYPGDIHKIVNAVFRAIEFWKQHPEEANQIMAPNFQISAEKYASILRGVAFTDRERNLAYFGTSAKDGPIFSVASRASDIWQSAGVIKSPVRAKSIVSQDFIR